ncbi:hypothetical protein BV898_11973 [Hypsibius exemplaris]|uniref:G-protein coupled receptors family 1 profile domain-containing protein n=1 Tax=Hypsibius exemplaris TaxID=2072580 RepID=A0A1W0WEZ6_HYPEX|nr:hypothetical protein BV898_11973 [Hypsibius exemplaris]
MIDNSANILYALRTLTGAIETFGETTCTYYLHVFWVECCVIYGQHAVIALSRMWAITHPISYRNRHTRPLALTLIIGVWNLRSCLYATIPDC